MGKQGPCYHCGVTSTPLWRNGPPEKPVLCNACGSRWRTKGSLINYTPLHSRAEPDDFVEYKIPRPKMISIKNKDVNLVKRKQIHEHVVYLNEALSYDQNCRRSLEEETSNRSSSGSAISYSESCSLYSGMDTGELTGSVQSVAWDTQVPSRKRTCVSRSKASSVEKLTKDLYSILHDQSSYFSGSSEEDLLFDDEAPMVSVEIGHGSILMKHPNSVAREEESEASSFIIDNKSGTVNEAYSSSRSLPLHIDSNDTNIRNASMSGIKKHAGQGMLPELKRRDKSHEKFQVIQNPNSLLGCIGLKDTVSFDEFVNHFTHEEQLQLMKYLPSVDTIKLPDSLRIVFDSLIFAENLSSFQKLLTERVIDQSFSEINADEFKTLKKLALVDLAKSNWVQHYNLLKASKYKQKTGGKEIAITSKTSQLKRPRDSETQQVRQAMMRSPKRVVMKSSFETKDIIDQDSLCFSPKSLFAVPPEKSSLMLDYMQASDDSYDQDVLLDIPSNGSFAQAELLYPTSSFGSQQASTSSSTFYPQLT